MVALRRTVRIPGGLWLGAVHVDNVVVCAGQEPLRDLAADVRASGVPVHLVGGADVAVELDAKRAIAQATMLALVV